MLKVSLLLSFFLIIKVSAGIYEINTIKDNVKKVSELTIDHIHVAESKEGYYLIELDSASIFKSYTIVQPRVEKHQLSIIEFKYKPSGSKANRGLE